MDSEFPLGTSPSPAWTRLTRSHPLAACHSDGQHVWWRWRRSSAGDWQVRRALAGLLGGCGNSTCLWKAAWTSSSERLNGWWHHSSVNSLPSQFSADGGGGARAGAGARPGAQTGTACRTRPRASCPSVARSLDIDLRGFDPGPKPIAKKTGPSIELYRDVSATP